MWLDARSQKGLQTLHKPLKCLVRIGDSVGEVTSNVGDRLLNDELIGLQLVNHRAAKDNLGGPEAVRVGEFASHVSLLAAPLPAVPPRSAGASCNHERTSTPGTTFCYLPTFALLWLHF
jgi:hypothetical protein